MSNSFFHFKQFTINQGRCAMKVCTDSCLFGALMELPNKGRVLDIGTGTGLLAFMAAQREEVIIEAVEMEKEDAKQAAENFLGSAFSNRITLIEGDVKDHSLPIYNNTYDCIISNPPFFENHLKSPDGVGNTAKHTDELSYDDLVSACVQLLAPEGVLNILLPYQYSDVFIAKALKENIHLNKRIDIKNYEGREPFRSVLIFKRQSSQVVNDEIVIYEFPGNYTEETYKLLQPYYLYL